MRKLVQRMRACFLQTPTPVVNKARRN